MRLKYLQAFKLDEVPDHIGQEMIDFSIKIGKVLLPLIKEVDPNIALGALNWVHASVVKELVDENPETLEQAAKLTAFTLLKNIELLKSQMEEAKKS